MPKRLKFVFIALITLLMAGLLFLMYGRANESATRKDSTQMVMSDGKGTFNSHQVSDDPNDKLSDYTYQGIIDQLFFQRDAFFVKDFLDGVYSESDSIVADNEVALVLISDSYCPYCQRIMRKLGEYRIENQIPIHYVETNQDIFVDGGQLVSEDEVSYLKEVLGITKTPTVLALERDWEDSLSETHPSDNTVVNSRVVELVVNADTGDISEVEKYVESHLDDFVHGGRSRMNELVSDEQGVNP